MDQWKNNKHNMCYSSQFSIKAGVSMPFISNENTIEQEKRLFMFKLIYQFPQKLSKIAVADCISNRLGGVLVKVFN